MSRLLTASDGDYIQLPWGELIFHNNEWHLRTSVNDPAGVSFIGADGSKISWKDKDGNEKVLFQLRQNPKGDGEFYFGTLSMAVLHQTGNLDRAMIEVATINPDGVEFRVPVKFSAGSAGVGSGSGEPSAIVSPGRRYRAEMQPDGNFVIYDMRGGPRAVFATGVVDDPSQDSV